jgi:uncharacterized protein (DUF1697 family)
VTTYALLLRGINVGGNKKIAMSDLRDLLTGIGHGEARTLLQSGNAVFTTRSRRSADRLAAEIEAAITDKLAMTVRCLLRTAAELRAVVERNPLVDTASNHSRLMVTFLSEPPDPKKFADVKPADVAPDEFALGKCEVYSWMPNGQLNTNLDDKFWKGRLSGVTTARNWNTVTKLLAMAESLKA